MSEVGNAFSRAFENDPLTNAVRAVGGFLGRVGENMTEGRYLQGTAQPAPEAPKPRPAPYDRSAIRRPVSRPTQAKPITPSGSTVRQPVSNVTNQAFQPFSSKKNQATMTNNGWQMNGINMTPEQTASYFGKSRAALASGKGPLSDGTYMPMGGYVANMDAPGLGPNFTGQPTMYPVQQSIGNDIFGNTADLFRKRDSIQAEMDAFYSKNPLSGTDLMGNFNKIAAMAGHRNQLKELGETMRNRDTIMGNLMGHLAGAQATTQSAGIRADADIKSANIMAGKGGKVEDPMKGPLGMLEHLSKFASNPEALASMPPAFRKELETLIPTLTQHLKRGYGVGLSAEATGSDDELLK